MRGYRNTNLHTHNHQEVTALPVITTSGLCNNQLHQSPHLHTYCCLLQHSTKTQTFRIGRKQNQQREIDTSSPSIRKIPQTDFSS